MQRKWWAVKFVNVKRRLQFVSEYRLQLNLLCLCCLPTAGKGKGVIVLKMMSGSFTWCCNTSPKYCISISVSRYWLILLYIIIPKNTISNKGVGLQCIMGNLKWKCFCADVSIDVPDTLDLSALRATGQQPGEELLPEVAPPPLMTPDVEVKGILGSHGNEEDDSLYSPLLC